MNKLPPMEVTHQLSLKLLKYAPYGCSGYEMSAIPAGFQHFN